MFSFEEENEYLPIKTAAEYFYCQRAAFYMITNWENDIESQFFYKGSVQHEVSKRIILKHRIGSKIIYHFPLINHKLKIYGFCDAVEFLKDSNLKIYPIEYKTGKIRFNFMHKAQLALQIFCLEEMFDIQIKFGYLYFIESHARKKVVITSDDREYILDKVREFKEKLKNPQIKDFKPCKSPFCSYHSIDTPIIYK